MARLYTVVDGLSPEGRRVIWRGAQEKWSAERTCQELMSATQEKVSLRTMGRHLANLRTDLERKSRAREQMDALVGALRDGDASAA